MSEGRIYNINPKPLQDEAQQIDQNIEIYYCNKCGVPVDTDDTYIRECEYDGSSCILCIECFHN
jgi:hypothetical protein